LEDLRYAGEPIEATFLGELTEAQLQAVTAMAKHDNGIIVAPPGFGKAL
jgi:superfamily II DNA or RNA helicase